MGYIMVHLHMHAGMGGPHHFLFHVKTNDPNRPEVVLSVKANFVELTPTPSGT
jgi:hypothetical protein